MGRSRYWTEPLPPGGARHASRLVANRADAATPGPETIMPVAGSSTTATAHAQAAHHPLTEAQTGLWYAQRLAPDNPAFNTAHALWINGVLDVAALQCAADQAAREAA